MDPVSVVGLVAATVQPAGLCFTLAQSLNKKLFTQRVMILEDSPQSWCSTYMKHVDGIEKSYVRFQDSLSLTVELVELLWNASIWAGRIEETQISERLRRSATAVLASLRDPRAN
jgi:hypothetical protein